MADWEYRSIELNDPRSEATELDLLGKTARRLGARRHCRQQHRLKPIENHAQSRTKTAVTDGTTNRRLPNEKVKCLPAGPVRRRSQSVRQSRPHEPRSAGLIPRCEEFRSARQSQKGAKEGEVPACAHLPR